MKSGSTSIVSLMLLALVASSCTSITSGVTLTSTPHPKPTTSPPAGLVPALVTHNPEVVVTPSSGLKNGEAVQVSVTGFGQGGEFRVSECASAADANSYGCGPQLSAQTLGVTDNAGRGTVTYKVSRSAFAHSLKSPYGLANIVYEQVRNRSNCRRELRIRLCYDLVRNSVTAGYVALPIDLRRLLRAISLGEDESTETSCAVSKGCSITSRARRTTPIVSWNRPYFECLAEWTETQR